MKALWEYILKHLATFLTLVIMVITGVWVNVTSDIPVVYNVIIGAIVALTISFLADFLRRVDHIEAEFMDLKQILPTSRIESFESVDQIALHISNMVRKGKHDVDIVLYDTRIRSQDEKKINKMHDLMRVCANKKSIKMRLAFVPSEDSINQRIMNYIESEEKKSNSFYAYTYSELSFASFMIIDGKYVSIRTPHKDGSQPKYCIVKDFDLCNLYQSWFDILWSEAEHLSHENIQNLMERYEKEINIEEIKKRIEKL